MISPIKVVNNKNFVQFLLINCTTLYLNNDKIEETSANYQKAYNSINICEKILFFIRRMLM